jgi:PAT family beta-lactamase induction signal transducer AmpG
MLKYYLDRRVWVIFILGFASGFPWVLIGSAMSAWLKEAGLTRSAIGFFGSIFVVYAINFLWAPLLDRLRPPLLGRFGQRRSWLLMMLLIMYVAVLFLARTDPATTLWWTSAIALIIAFASATQDISIDAYRIETIRPDEQHLIPIGSAMATSGWWTGYSLPGAFAFYYADADGVNWSDVYVALSFILIALMVFVLFIKEPASNRKRLQADIEAAYMQKISDLSDSSKLQRILAWLAVTIAEPLAEFFRRNGVKLALSILAFVFLFKIGEAFLGRMSIVFYKEVGFSNSEIATYSKLIGWWVTIVFAILGSFINTRFGILKGLLIGGIAMAASNLMFSVIAHYGPNTNLFAAAVVVDGFTGAFATVAFVSFITSLTSRTYTATQYALLASLGNLGRTVVSSSSGVMVDGLDGNWSLFFIITALMVIPSILILLWIARKYRHIFLKV